MNSGAEVVLFQSPITSRSGRRTLADQAAGGEVQKEQCDPRESAGALQQLHGSVGELVILALDAAHIKPARAARIMGISLSLFLRQLKNIDNQHLSLQRLYRLPDAFWRELWLLIVERRKLGRVRRRVVFDVEV